MGGVRIKQIAWSHLAPVRVHIDHLENEDQDVWAVRQGRRYATVHAVTINVPLDTVFRGAKAPQPRAFLVGTGMVTIEESSDGRRRAVIWRPR